MKYYKFRHELKPFYDYTDEEAKSYEYFKDFMFLMNPRRAEMLFKANQKLENLTEMRMGGEITKEEFQSYKLKVNQEIIKLEQEISEIGEKSKANLTDEKQIITFEEFSELIKNEVDLSNPFIERSLLEQIIFKIIPNSELEFRWYLNLLPHKNEEDFIEIQCFTIRFPEAKAYRNMRREMLRKNQWWDLTVHLYV